MQPTAGSDLCALCVSVVNLLFSAIANRKSKAPCLRKTPLGDILIVLLFRRKLMVEKGVEIAPAEGKLGVLLVGLGAVSTTLVAGVEAIKRGISEPIGSLTQMGTIRLGKRTDNRSPKIKDFVPLASLDDIVFGAWDIFHDSAYDAAMNAGVLDKDLLNQVSEPLSSLKPMAAVFEQNYVKRLTRRKRQDRQEQDGPGRAANRRHRPI